MSYTPDCDNQKLLIILIWVICKIDNILYVLLAKSQFEQESFEDDNDVFAKSPPHIECHSDINEPQFLFQEQVNKNIYVVYKII